MSWPHRCSCYKLIVNSVAKRACLSCYENAMLSTHQAGLGFKHVIPINQLDVNNDRLTHAHRPSNVHLAQRDSAFGVDRNQSLSNLNLPVQPSAHSDTAKTDTSSTGASSETSTDLESDAKTKGAFAPWAEGLLLISNDTRGGSKSAHKSSQDGSYSYILNEETDAGVYVRSIMPDEGLSAEIVREVLEHTRSSFASSVKSHDMNFMLKLKSPPQIPTATASVCYAFVLFRDHPSSICFDDLVPTQAQPQSQVDHVALGAHRHRGRFALVLLSQWLFPQLAYQCLSVLADALLWSVTNATSAMKLITDKNVSTAEPNAGNVRSQSDRQTVVEYGLVADSNDIPGQNFNNTGGCMGVISSH
jgi:hypothetical protein